MKPRRPWPMVAVAVAAALLLCCLPLAAVISEEPAAIACTGAVAGSSVPAVSGGAAVDRWTVEQVDNAAIIVSVGVQRHVPPRGWIIAVATAMQESNLRNLGDLGTANDADSLGLFQQRPSQGWGSAAQILDPRYASGRFYDKLLTIPGWQTRPLTEAAQAVQASAFPDAYAKWEQAAATVVVAVTHVASVADLPGASLTNCGPPGPVGSSGWTQPVHAGIVSGYRTPQRPAHYGVDLGASRGATIRAAAAGRVVWAICDASTGNCDIDGSPNTPGCGWYVDLLHANNVGTRYCHMVQRPAVTVGQNVAAGEPIGIVGTSGNSSGPHLHFEVHLNVTCNSRCALNHDNATDPAPFMTSVGAPFGR